MDETHFSSGKKQRPKNQRDRRRPQEKNLEPATGVVSSNAPDPQPQRSARRQRNPVDPPAAQNVAGSTPPALSEKASSVEKENVVIDFSNLKRETEEITKLTKKFSRREIASNWHRYAAPEGVKDDGSADEEGPADFSALIQVPASRGGHLQLKDEQDWSSASGEELGGYFALNLKLLSQSLACIPLYEQLRLPTNMFIEEELKHFDNVAYQAKSCYNPDNMVDQNRKIMKTMTNLLQREAEINEEPKTRNDIQTLESFNILDLENSNRKLLNIEVESEARNVNPSILTLKDESKDPLGNNSDVNLKRKNKSIDIVKIEKNSNNTISEHAESTHKVIEPEQEKILGHITNNLLEEKSVGNLSEIEKHKEYNILEPRKGSLPEDSIFKITTKPKEISPEKENLTLSLSALTHKSVENIETPKLPSKNIEGSRDIAREINTVQEITGPNLNSENISISQPKEKRSKSNRKTPVKDTDENKTQNNGNGINLAEDDDLDFLLSLKKPVPSESKKESKPIPVKDSSFLPGSGTTAQAAPKQQHSELDDWLDSVLED